jgi:hypothetical protein
VIGLTFTGPLLLGILPKHLKEHLSASIDVLLHQKWLYQDTECDTLYQFAHPHAHKIIYQLTPSSERNHLHAQIAEYIEDTYGVDKTQFAALSYHYQHCDTDKALMYSSQAVMALLDSTKVLFDFGDCVDLLFEAFNCVKTTYDCDVMLRLIKDTITAIEMCYELSKAERADTRASIGWSKFFNNVVRTLSVLTTRSSVSSGRGGGNSAKYSAKVVPGDGSESAKDSIGFSNSTKGFDNETEDGESDLADDDGSGGLDYERKARRTFIAQLHRLEDQVCQKQTEILCSQNGGAGGGGGDDDDVVKLPPPSDWQADLLGLA